MEKAMVSSGVHEAHCCLKHGCKYGDDDCPVADGRVKQMYPCETCEWDTCQDCAEKDAEIKSLKADIFALEVRESQLRSALADD